MSASRALPKLAVTASAAGFTVLAGHQLEKRRTELPASFSASTVPAALATLQSSGVCVVDALRINERLVSEVKAMPAAETMPKEQMRHKPQRRRGPPGAPPKDDTWRLSAVGRYHRLENHLGPADIEVLERIEKQLWPLVEGFFEEDGGNIDDVFRSELQLMSAVPGATHQSWHKDNTARGLSILVPLIDFTPENGATQLLLGTHREDYPVGDDGGARVVRAPEGSVVAYDSRTIHRGLGNDTSAGRPALIFCYDRKETPPPGSSTLGSIGVSYRGRFVDVVSGAREVLASWVSY